ncbi:GTP-binding protein Rheb-like isoform X1 [Clavelina lepadiformis]|uniref:GTP-binding protein Rheb-like isoform X1 n=1 Tax=Clavelina lepadiformis TaxID=159417 RepID=UPI0040413E39
MASTRYRKLAILGYRTAGKTAITIQFVKNEFVTSYRPTIEDTYYKKYTLNEQNYELDIVDTAGQEDYSLFPVSCSLDVYGYVLVYSVTSVKSFEVVKVIHDELMDVLGRIKIPIVLVGNKTDLDRERKVSTEEGRELAQSWNAIFLETSAKEDSVRVDVKAIIDGIIKEIEKQDGDLPEEKSCIVS